MRFTCLRLIRYGCFSDATLSLERSPDAPDLHLIYGPNEAGKSTAMTAIEDFLFGIPSISPFNFQHNYSDMRIGATLTHRDQTLGAQRRKGNRDTLLTADGDAVSAKEGALIDFLSGADQAFFTRMFSLDHERLRQGGEQILNEKDDAGRTLFAAATGITGISERLQALEQEADTIWGKRRAEHRQYFKAKDRFDEASRLKRDHTLKAEDWRKLERDCATAETETAQLTRDIEAKEAEQRRISRIRRVQRIVRTWQDLRQQLDRLPPTVTLPPDAHERLETAMSDKRDAQTRIDTLRDRIAAARDELQKLNSDAAILARTKDIQMLAERRIQARAARTDLPLRQSDLQREESRLQQMGRELHWQTDTTDALIERIPIRAKIAALRTLRSEYGALCLQVSSAEKTLKEEQSRLIEIEQQQQPGAVAVDVTRLNALLKAHPGSADLESRIREAKSKQSEAEDRIQRQQQKLQPPADDLEQLLTMPAPTTETVRYQRDQCRDLEQQSRECANRISTETRHLEQQQKQQQRVVNESRAVSVQMLQQARQRREQGWDLIRRCYIERAPVSGDDLLRFVDDPDDIVVAYQDAVHTADDTADQRFDTAEATAKLETLSEQIAAQEDKLSGWCAEQQEWQQRIEAHNRAWRSLWDPALIVPLSADQMLDWLDVREQIQCAVKERDDNRSRLADLCQQQADAIARFTQELIAIGNSSEWLQQQSLAVVLAEAEHVCNEHQQIAKAQRKLQDARLRVNTDVELKQEALNQARAQMQEWSRRWCQAVTGLRLDPQEQVEVIADQVETIEAMRAVTARINELRNERIAPMEQSIAAFERDTVELISALSADLVDVDADAAALELDQRREQEQQTKQEYALKRKEINACQDKVAQQEGCIQCVLQSIEELQSAAGVSTPDELRRAIERSTKRRQLEDESEQLKHKLEQDGDGYTLDDLSRECAEHADLDQLAASEQSLIAELEELRQRQTQARDRQRTATTELQESGGGDGAARAEADRQIALADMCRLAEHYARVRTATLLLRWSIDRYRRERQSPLLSRAGEIFSILTAGSFTALTLDFDDKDRAHLAGLRTDDTPIGTAGMSAGTADQLYLALRVAAIEDYLQPANELPFIADDLFIHFDDQRAAAGFRILGQLANNTQVLFFTHHQHLLDIAKAAVDGVNVVSLPG